MYVQKLTGMYLLVGKFVHMLRMWHDNVLKFAMVLLKSVVLIVLIKCAYPQEPNTVSQCHSSSSISSALMKSTLFTKQRENYVNRPVLEEQILAIYYNVVSDSDSYTVVVGPSGSGKTFAVERTLQNKPGVVKILVTDEDNVGSIISKMLRCYSACVCDDVLIDLDALARLLRYTAGKQGGRRVTVVLDVIRGPSGDAGLMMIKSIAKYLGGSANVMVVTEGNAAIDFGDDRRQDFLWVDGMTRDEATSLARKLFPPVSDSDLVLFYNQVHSHRNDIEYL